MPTAKPPSSSSKITTGSRSRNAAPTASNSKSKTTSTVTKRAKSSAVGTKKQTTVTVKSAKPAGKTEKLDGKQQKVRNDAAKKIQTKVRQFLAKIEVEKRRKQKNDYENLMLKLEREAYVHVANMQREEAERRHQIEDEERKRKQAERRRRKRMLEAAYDGDLDVIKTLVKEISDLDSKNNVGHDAVGRSLRTKHLMAVLDCEDANDNTPLSEAANGGSADTVRFLLEKGVEPNSQGQFQRTPLFRAAFLGHAAAVRVLLEYGGDPRIYAVDSQVPLDVASTDEVKQLLENWDIAKTDELLKRVQENRDKRKEEDRKRREYEASQAEDVVAKAQKQYEIKEQQLLRASAELEKRITEHDTYNVHGFDRPHLMTEAIHSHELEVETLRQEVAKSREKLAKARLQLREAVTEDDDHQDNLPGTRILVKDLEDVLFRDVGNKIKDSGKWPMVIDTTGLASTFLRYRDTNYLTALRPADMQNNNIRRALLGAIRFGKPFIVDMMAVDMFQVCVDRFGEIQPGLMDSIMDGSILEESKYLKLVKKEDGPEYTRNKFNDFRKSHFKFIVMTSNPFPNQQLMEDMYILRCVLPD